MEKQEYGIKQEFQGDRFGVTSKTVTTEKKTIKEAHEYTQLEIAVMFVDMLVNHKIMESRIQKLENRVSMLTSLISQKGIEIPS